MIAGVHIHYFPYLKTYATLLTVQAQLNSCSTELCRGSKPLDFLLIFELSRTFVPLIILSHFCIDMQGRAWNSAYDKYCYHFI